tara:strand:- start:187 stop:471 length:285 start_codon:yes stop_codon:yes gene_type:complete
VRKEILIGSDYERKGDVYYFDRASLKWIGHPSSKSRWNVYITACLVLQRELTQRALSAGYDYEIFYPPKPAVSKPKAKKKVTKAKTSSTFISLF